MADHNQQPHVSDPDKNGNEIPNNHSAPTTNGADQTAAGAAAPAHVTINFRTADGAEVSFKLKSTTKLKKAMDAYAARAQRDKVTLRFLFEGERVLDENTAESMGMEDGDTIEVHSEQIGGGGEEA